MEFENNYFSWAGLFVSTAAFCLLFNGMLKLVEGSFSKFLFVTSGVAVVLAVLAHLTRAGRGHNNESKI